MMRIHLWRGELIDDQQLDQRIEGMGTEIADLLRKQLDIHVFIEAADALGAKLRNPKSKLYGELQAVLNESGLANEKDVRESLETVGEFLRSENLLEKLKRELGTKTPFTPSRILHDRHVFECWAPLGMLVHVAPTNALTVGSLSVIEGMLAGNVNFLKTSASDSLFPQYLLKALCEEDSTGHLRDFALIARFSSKRSDWMKKILGVADGVAAWGGEESIAGVRSLCPAGVKFIDWGPKISFSYVAASAIADRDVMKRIAEDVCVLDQQACSSPQCVYVESEDRSELLAFAKTFSEELSKVSARMSGTKPDLNESAEITNVTELAKLGACLGENDVHVATDGSWRVLVEFKPGLRASPLYRTVWVKPLVRRRVIEVLHPLRSYLQTAGLAGKPEEMTELASLLYRAGVQRFTGVGCMHESYMGEPHDGRYALPSYARKISFQFGSEFRGISNLEELTHERFSADIAKSRPIMTKQDFQDRLVEEKYADLFFKSGGSSGEPKLSVFTYDDYHTQMAAAADGLYAAGLDPDQDRCMNLFFGGGLYGGFLSFFTILEHIRAVQFPMASVDDHEFVARTIVQHKVNVLLGMPSYLIHLFNSQAEILGSYKGIKKIFFGGEHFNTVQKAHLMKEFGIEQITSATYGSVDAGPLGFQCSYSEGGTHHLHTRLQSLEILQRETDEPVRGQEAGRLVFSSKVRQGQSIVRYEIGDLGRWVEGTCRCGRVAPRFELLGRYGDVCRIGTTYVNYKKIEQIITDHFDYGGELQLLLRGEGHSREKLVICVNASAGLRTAAVRETLLECYHDVDEVVKEALLDVEVKAIEAAEFQRVSGSGKLRHIVDERSTR